MERHARAHKHSAIGDERMLRDVLPQNEGAKALNAAPVPAGWKLRRLSDITADDVSHLRVASPRSSRMRAGPLHGE